ncbi:hemin uptake protein HemP [Agrobacterium sp. ES01]|uniref:hemin uptake protein HemP n=1 Tax=Agrobacterium sp. ES01 TaxID=3420714 RepID=UPI003D0A4092
MTGRPNPEIAGSTEHSRERHSPVTARSVASVPVVDSRDLFNGKQEVGIIHEGALYRLKITRQGKLILNK